MDEGLQHCVNMLKENEEDVRKAAENTLLTLCRDILKNPEKEEHRQLRLDDPIVIERLLPAVGAMECLINVGFVEATDSFHLPRGVSLEKLQALEVLLAKVHSKESKVENVVQGPSLPSVKTEHRDSLIDRIKAFFSNVLRYEDKELQQKARNIIPISELEIATISRIRDLQRHIKIEQNTKENSDQEHHEHDINPQDLFLVELVNWFKTKFFKWVDSPTCPACLGESKLESITTTKDRQCTRIELHRCTRCQTLVKFPRYSDPDPLLTTRCGRCGEWANTFTLLCRALGYDARLIYDDTDHLWTEVWSVTQKRWIHVDPCENVIDQPLMYERGWGKKLTYIIAFSKDEIQDVTWRYTRDQRMVMKRRKYCSEENLLKFIELLNAQRQTAPGYSTHRRDYIVRRRLLELVELIQMPSTHDRHDGKTYGGRTTGSYAWRLARGEVSPKNTREDNYTWDISRYNSTFQLQYSVVKDTYRVIDDSGAVLEEKSGWQNGVSMSEGGMFRKVENDWKVVYLARSPNTPHGSIKWTFEIRKPNTCVSSFSLRALVKAFHGAKVSWSIKGVFGNNENQSKSHVLPIEDCSNYNTNELRGAIKIILTAKVSGGEGDNAWQHAQLFRQSLDSNQQSIIAIIRQEKRLS